MQHREYSQSTVLLHGGRWELQPNVGSTRYYIDLVGLYVVHPKLMKHTASTILQLKERKKEKKGAVGNLLSS